MTSEQQVTKVNRSSYSSNRFDQTATDDRRLTVPAMSLSRSWRFVSVSRVRCSRGLSSYPIPMPPRDPDNVYRRPGVQPPRAPLSEDDDLTWSDPTAPESAVDRYNHIMHRSTALLSLIAALTVVCGGGLSLAYLLQREDPTEPMDFPFDGLREEISGRTDIRPE